MPPSLRKAVAAAIGGGAIAIASVLITGPSGNDGLEGVSYIPYKDIVGVWTVCHGHTGKDIIPGKTYTEAECKALLNKDLATVARQINPYIKVDIPETTRGALYSFVYNVGAGNFRTSTLLRKINQGDIKGACDQLRRWAYAGGKQWKGLMTRREIEREVCLWGQQEQGNRDYLRSVICIIVCLSWPVNHYRDNAIAYKEQRDNKASELEKANATITDMQQRQRDADALDDKYTKELADAKAENDALRRKLDNGGRVLVKGKCPVPSSAETSSASGMGNDATVELSPVAGRNVLGIRDGIIRDQTALRTLQEYIRTQCLR